MAEAVFLHEAERRGVSKLFFVSSAATSLEEIGNDIHDGTKRILDRHGIAYQKRQAVQLAASDRNQYDLFIGMDGRNVAQMTKILGSDAQIRRLLDGTPSPHDVADPWYTGDFETTFRDILEGVNALLETLCGKAARSIET